MKNWKTTFMGWGAGLITAADAIISAAQAGQLNGKHGKELILALVFIVWGTVQHDAGGSSSVKPN